MPKPLPSGVAGVSRKGVAGVVVPDGGPGRLCVSPDGCAGRHHRLEVRNGGDSVVADVVGGRCPHASLNVTSSQGAHVELSWGRPCGRPPAPSPAKPAPKPNPAKPAPPKPRAPAAVVAPPPSLPPPPKPSHRPAPIVAVEPPAPHHHLRRAYVPPPGRKPTRGTSLVTMTLLLVAPAVLAAAAFRPRSRGGAGARGSARS
ncbi:hypothetical protein [Wenjunlia tyrosinilytica]|uniref:hypothetical protein n=1 Tax=Wenjunlia tyrosinilytica TaxID=1544741 RepID=UPI00166A80C1|nr:hypothetical protein [Wenjunlia tyrosinilytica]